MIERLEHTIVTTHRSVVYGITKAGGPPSAMSFSISRTPQHSADVAQHNRDQLCRELGFTTLCFQRQVHGAEFQWVDDQYQNVGSSDALITSMPGVLLCASVADCCGVLIYDVQGRVVSAVHSGWRGTHANIVRGVVQEIVSRLHIPPSDLCAWLSPCASGRRYTVRSDVQQLFPQYCTRVSEDQFLLDNPGAIRQQLIDLGLSPQSIVNADICTIEDREYHSFRRDADNSGRMAAFIGIQS